MLINITAPGMLYVLDDAIYAFSDMDVANGNAEPSRTIQIDGVAPGTKYTAMQLHPRHDMAFVTVQDTPVTTYLIDNISTATGTVQAFSFASPGYANASVMTYR